MGTKVTLSPFTTLEGSSAIPKLNSDLDTLADEFDNVVYRDGSFDMLGPINMNSQRIYNLPTATGLGDPITLGQLQTAVLESGGSVTEEAIVRASSDSVRPTFDQLLANSGASLIGTSAGDTVEEALVSRIEHLATRTEVGTYPVVNKVVYLTEAGREGVFVWDASNLSTKVTDDTVQGIYIAPASDPTGSSGAWVRKFKGAIYPEWFGALGDGVVDDTTALQSAVNQLGADGGGTLCFTQGKTYLVSNWINLEAVSNIKLDGNGATLKRALAGTVATSIRILNCTNIEITGLNIDSGYNGATSGTTGSQPNIFVTSDVGSMNRNIWIHRNKIRNGNQSNILVDGRSRTDGLTSQQNIWIHDNDLGSAGFPIFIYKGVDGIWICDNSIDGCSVAGLYLDTRAESDADTTNYQIRNGRVSGNRIKNVSTLTGFAGRGMVIKGGIFDVLIDNNNIENVVSLDNAATYGISIVKDFGGQSGGRIIVADNIVKGVTSTGGTGAWALSLGEGFDGVLVDGNTFEDCERGVELNNMSSWRFVNNRCKNLAYSLSTTVSVVAGTGTSGRKYMGGNNYIRGAAGATYAIDIVASVTNLHCAPDSFDGFTTRSLVAAGAVVSSEEIVVGRGSVAYAGGTLTTDSGAVLQTVAGVTGATTTDRVDLNVSGWTGYRNITLNGYISPAGTVNAFGQNGLATSVVLPATTIFWSVMRDCLTGQV